MRAKNAMQRDWDARAKKNALHYIASWKTDWDLTSFFKSGEDDFQRLVGSVLERCGLPSTGKTMAELGCGVGRMTGSFARRYESVLALDISPEMLVRATQLHSEKTNILWTRVGGLDLACIQSYSVDFVFSYLVLQHLPNETLAFEYVREMLRVLRPNGVFLFQFNGSRKPTMNLRGRIAWGAVNALWSANFTGLSRFTARLFGFDPSVVGKTWQGAAIETNAISEVVKSCNGEIREIIGRDTPMNWCCGSKLAVE